MIDDLEKAKDRRLAYDLVAKQKIASGNYSNENLAHMLEVEARVSSSESEK